MQGGLTLGIKACFQGNRPFKRIGMASKSWHQFYQQAGLKTRLLILVLAIAMPLMVAVAFFISSRALGIIESSANQNFENTHHLLSNSVSQWLDTHTKAFLYFVSQPDIVVMKPDLQRRLLKKMAAYYPYMYLISTTNLQGINIARSDELPMIDYSDRLWFQQAKTGIPVTFESVISKTTSKPVLVVSMPIKDEGGRISGVGMFAMHLESLSRQVRVTRLGKTGFAYVVDNQDRVIAHPDQAFAGELQNVGTYPPVQALRKGHRGAMSFKDQTGEAWRAHVDILDNGWGIVVQQKEKELLNPRRVFQQMALAIVIGVLLTMVILSWWVVRKTLRPIDILTQTVAGLTSGKFSHSVLIATRHNVIDIRSRNDEIGMLADSFYKMSEQLQDTLSNLQQELAEHKRIDAELVRERSILSTILENDPSGVALINKKGVFEYVNPEFTRITGYALLDIPKESIWLHKAYPGQEYRDHVVETYRRNRKSSNKTADAEFIMTCKDGKTKEVEFRTTFIDEGTVNVLNDVTQRRRAEKALQESEEKYRNIFENALEGIFQTTPDGKLLSVNPALAEMYGSASPEEMINDMNNIGHQLYVNIEDRKRFARILEKDGIIEEFEVEFFTRAGGKIWVSLKARAIRNSEGKSLYYEGMAENITERKRVEEEIRNKSEQLRELTWKLSEIEENERKSVSRELHDTIGQNLAILGLNLNILQTLISENSTEVIQSRLSDSMAIVKQTTESIRNLMADLRSPVLDDYGLVAAVRLFGEQCAFRAGIEVTVHGTEPDPRLPAHVENAMFRIVQEALTNMIKHAQATEATVHIWTENGRLYVTVSDNGIGYNAADTSMQNNHRGWGHRTMMERAISLGGAGKIISNPGEGTHVFVEAPL